MKTAFWCDAAALSMPPLHDARSEQLVNGDKWKGRPVKDGLYFYC